MRKRAAEVLERLGLDFDPARPLHELGLAEWKLVEIARGLLSDARFLILDEPTALLDRRDSRTVLATVERLREEGLGIALITHRLDEALEVADRFTVLRDGRQVATLPRDGTTTRMLVDHIVGDAATAQRAPELDREVGTEPAVTLRQIQLRPEATPFDLTVSRGEIFGLTGLIGAGALELARGLGGRDKLTGDVEVAGRRVKLGSPPAAVAAGLGYVPEDRKEAGLVGCLPVEVNLSLASLGDICPKGFLRRSRMRAVAQRYADELGIRASSLSAPVETLSGGNQQKVQIAKWLASGQQVLVIESPTHGVDVGAKAEIHRMLQEFTAKGGTVIVASTDIPDVLAVADRIAVFGEGELVDVVAGARSTHRELMLSGGGDDTKLEEIEELIAV
jgi:rhamnose transport system ATP-binding protein